MAVVVFYMEGFRFVLFFISNIYDSGVHSDGFFTSYHIAKEII